MRGLVGGGPCWRQAAEWVFRLVFLAAQGEALLIKRAEGGRLVTVAGKPSDELAPGTLDNTDAVVMEAAGLCGRSLHSRRGTGRDPRRDSVSP